MDTSPKVNVVEWLEFEIASYDVAVQHVSHYATETSIYWIQRESFKLLKNLNCQKKPTVLAILDNTLYSTLC